MKAIFIFGILFILIFSGCVSDTTPQEISKAGRGAMSETTPTQVVGGDFTNDISEEIKEGKSFNFQSASNDYVITSDGSIKVTENMSIEFYGKFSEGYREIPLNGIQISEIEVYSENKKIKHKEKYTPNGIEISWDLSESSQQSFVISYKLENALKVYDDVAEFNAKVWGDQWDISLQKLSGTIELPRQVDNPGDVYTFGHPQLEGAIVLQNNKDVVYEIHDIPANQWAEVRVVFPRHLLTSTSGAQIIEGKGLGKILSEEGIPIEVQLSSNILYETITDEQTVVLSVYVTNITDETAENSKITVLPVDSATLIVHPYERVITTLGVDEKRKLEFAIRTNPNEKIYPGEYKITVKSEINETVFEREVVLTVKTAD